MNADLPNTAELPAIARPLSLGELLDRVITILVRRFPLWAGILATVTLPLAVLQVIVPPSSTRMLDALQTAIKTGDQHAVAAAIAQNPTRPSDFIYILVALAFTPLADCAAIAAFSRRYDGLDTTYGEAFRIGLRRWLPALLLFVVWFVGFVAIAVVLAIVLGALAGILIAAFPHAQLFLIIVGVIAGLIALVAFLAIACISIPLLAVSLATIVVETPNPFVALGRTFSRVFRGREVWRALGVGAAFGFLSFSVGGAATSVGFLIGFLLHTTIVTTAVSAIVGIAIAAVQYGFMTYYYRDVRLRREGGDLVAMPSA
jgi:hypothetical protein